MPCLGFSGASRSIAADFRVAKCPKRAVFVDSGPALAAIATRLRRPAERRLEIGFGHADITPDELPEALAGAEVAVIDHMALPIDVARRCAGLRHVVFLGTGVRSYMSPEALAAIGISVDTIKGYGDTAVAEATIGLLFAAARGHAAMDRAMRQGQWLRTEGLQLSARRSASSASAALPQRSRGWRSASA